LAWDALTGVVGIIAVLITVFSINPFLQSQPRSACINDIETNYKISFTVELYVDGLRADIPANVSVLRKGDVREQSTRLVMMELFSLNGKKIRVLKLVTFYGFLNFP